MNKSVTRRILAIVCVVCGVGVLSYLAIFGEENALIRLGDVVLIVIGFYFGATANKM